MRNLLLILLLVSQSTFTQKALNISNVLKEIKKNEIAHDTIVLKQAILETGWFKSYTARNKNNIFGFWNSRAKQYYEFDRWEDSVEYYKKWQDRRYKGGDYYEFLEDIGYAADLNYTWKLRHIEI